MRIERSHGVAAVAAEAEHVLDQPEQGEAVVLEQLDRVVGRPHAGLGGPGDHDHAGQLDQVDQHMKGRQPGGQVDKHQIHRAEPRIKQPAERVAGIDRQRRRAVWRGRRRRRLLLAFNEAERHRLAVSELSRGYDAQAEGGRCGIDGLAGREAPQRFQPQHRKQSRRIEVAVHQRDLTSGHGQRRRQIDADRALTHPAAAAGNRHHGAGVGPPARRRRAAFGAAVQRCPLRRFAEDSDCQ